MKKFYSLFLILSSYIFTSCAKEANLEDEIIPKSNVPTVSTFVNEKEASEIAKEFISNNNILGPATKNDINLNMVCTNLTNSSLSKSKSKGSVKPAYYIYNIEKKGYVIVSANNATLPVLGFSTESTFDVNSIPSNMVGILETFEKKINDARKNNLTPNKSNKSKLITRSSTNNNIEPILGKIAWSQNSYYNANCPEKSPVGCVALATAQIMRYYKYPSSSIGYSSYRHLKYGKQSFDYNYNINWDEIPEKDLTEENTEVAKLCYGVAVGLKMNFTPEGSGTLQSRVVKLLTKHYYYPNTVKNILRINYSNRRWSKTILNELKHGRPVQYAGYSGFLSGGHSFVCDGYKSTDNTDFFHFNWGYGGYFNGYFTLDALDPFSTGEGHNNHQEAIIGFTPPVNKLVTNGIYELKPASAPLKNLDVYQNKKENGTNVGIYWKNRKRKNQQWKIVECGKNIYKIKPIHAIDKALTVSDKPYKEGLNVHIWDDKDSENQKWRFSPLGDGSYYRISPVNKPFNSLDAVFETANFRNVILWKGDQISINQKWKLVKIK